MLAAVASACMATGVAAAVGSSHTAAAAPRGTVLVGTRTIPSVASSENKTVPLLSLPGLGEIRFACSGFFFRNSGSGTVWHLMNVPSRNPVQVPPGQVISNIGGSFPGWQRFVGADAVATVVLTSHAAGGRCTGTANAMLNRTSGGGAATGAATQPAVVLSGTAEHAVVKPSARPSGAEVPPASVGDTARVLALPGLGELRVGCWTGASSDHGYQVFYVRNTQHSRLVVESDSRYDRPEIAAGAIMAVTGLSVRGVKDGIFPAVFRVTGVNGTATVIASAWENGHGRCTAAAQAIPNPVRRVAVRDSRGKSPAAATVLGRTITTPFAASRSRTVDNTDTVPVVPLPGLGEIRLTCALAPPGPHWWPGVTFYLRNTQSYPISVAADRWAAAVVAPGAFAQLAGLTFMTTVGHLQLGPGLVQLRAQRRIATIALSAHFTSNGTFVDDISRATSDGRNAGPINGCTGIAQATIN